MKKLAFVLLFIFMILVGVHFLLAPKSNEFVEDDLLEKIKVFHKQGVCIVALIRNDTYASRKCEEFNVPLLKIN